MFSKLSSRERLMVLFAASLVALLGIAFIGNMILEKRINQKNELLQARRDIKTLMKLREEIQSMSAAQQPPDQNQLLSIVTQSLEAHNLKPSNLTPGTANVGRNDQKITVSASFSGIPLEPLMQFLYDLEYKQTNGITVGNLRIQKSLSRETYNASVVIYAIQPLKQNR